jgi:hypothetical protein
MNAFSRHGAAMHSNRIQDDVVAAADGHANNQCISHNMRDIKNYDSKVC